MATSTSDQSAEPPGLRDLKRVAVTKRILGAARKVFIARGVNDADLAEVARIAEVGRATLYRYFDGKDALLVALMHEDWNRQAELFRRLVEVPELGSEQIYNWLSMLVSIADAGRSSIPIYQASFQALDMGSALRQHRERLMDILATRFKGFGNTPGRGRIKGALRLVQIEQFAIYSAYSNTPETTHYACKLMTRKLCSWL